MFFFLFRFPWNAPGDLSVSQVCGGLHGRHVRGRGCGARLRAQALPCGAQGDGRGLVGGLAGSHVENGRPAMEPKKKAYVQPQLWGTLRNGPQVSSPRMLTRQVEIVLLGVRLARGHEPGGGPGLSGDLSVWREHPPNDTTSLFIRGHYGSI